MKFPLTEDTANLASQMCLRFNRYSVMIAVSTKAKLDTVRGWLHHAGVNSVVKFYNTTPCVQMWFANGSYIFCFVAASDLTIRERCRMILIDNDIANEQTLRALAPCDTYLATKAEVVYAHRTLDQIRSKST